ncbi:hypothetical protein MKSMC1_25580 [Mycobacterium kansasii]|nr:hypothetical protein MKSMC1_25580 [Mycobacterium kansasii]
MCAGADCIEDAEAPPSPATAPNTSAVTTTPPPAADRAH